MRTQVGIIGAGPAGLTLAHLLHRSGVDCVVLESRSRDYVEKRIRAGVLEHGTVELFRDLGLADRLDREGLVHKGIELRFAGTGHRIPMTDLTGRSITVYGQQEVVKDLIAARLAQGGKLLFEAQALSVEHANTTQPIIRFLHGGNVDDLVCEFIVGCDGFHGIARKAIPSHILKEYERIYPFAWLGILARVAPSSEELIYACHDRGFALHSMRSPEISRHYLQCAPDEDIANWPDERIWSELRARFETKDGFELHSGPVLEKGITPMRSYVAEPMQYGRLFLAGDAAHIVPPTGAKGLNLAVADVRVAASSIAEYYASGDETPLTQYSAICLRRVWQVQHFSWWMTSLLHRFSDDEDGYQRRLQLAQLDYITSSKAAATSLSEHYVGLPLTEPPAMFPCEC